MSMHLQDHSYFWYFALFHFVNFRDVRTSTCMWESCWMFADALHENIHSNISFDNCFTLFYFVWSETLTQAHACGRTLVVSQTTGGKFCWFCWGHVRVATSSRLPGVYWFCVVLLRKTQASLQTDNPRLFLFLLITDNPCLIFIFCLSRITRVLFWVVQLPNSQLDGAHLHATTRSDVVNNLTLALLFLAHSFLEGTLEGTWCSWSFPRPRSLDCATAWAWLIFWNRNGIFF